MEVPGVEERVTKYLQKAQKENLGGDVEDAMVNCRKALDSMVQDDYSEVFPEKKKKWRPIPDMLTILNKEPDSRFHHPWTNLIGHTINDMTKGSAHDTELQWSSDANTPVDASLAITLVLYLLNKAYDSDIGSFVLLQQYVDDDQIDRGLREAISYGSGEHEDEMISKGVLEVADLIEERGGQLGYRELLETGETAQRIGKFEVAMGYYRQALRALENDDGAPHHIIHCRLSIAEIKVSLNKMEDAKADYQKILEDSRNPPTMDPHVESQALMRLFQIGILTSNYLSLEGIMLESLPLLLDAVEILDTIGPAETENLRGALSKLEGIYRSLGDEEKARETKKRWMELPFDPENFNLSPNSPDTQFIIEHIVGDTIESTPEEKISMLEPFLGIAKDQKNRLAEISIIRKLADIHLQNGEREKAVECLRTCIAFYRQASGGPSGPADEFNATLGLLKILDEDSPEYQELFAEAEEFVTKNRFKTGEQVLMGLSWLAGGEITEDSPPEEKFVRIKMMIRNLEFMRQEPEPNLKIIAELNLFLGELFIGEDRETISGIITREDATEYLREALKIHKSLDSDTEVIQELYNELRAICFVRRSEEDLELITEEVLCVLHEEMLYFQKIGKTSEFSRMFNRTFANAPVAARMFQSIDGGAKFLGIPSILEKLEDPDISPSMREKYQGDLDGMFGRDFFQAEPRYLIRLPYKIGISLLALTLFTIVISPLYYLLMIANLGNLVTAAGVIILLPILITILGGISAVLPLWQRSLSREDMFRFRFFVIDEESGELLTTPIGQVALYGNDALGEEE